MTRPYQTTPAYRERKRLYDRERYLRLREQKLAQDKTHRAEPEVAEARRAYWRDRHELLKDDPEYIERRRRTGRLYYYRRMYGTETPTPGQLSLDGRLRFNPRGPAKCRNTPSSTKSPSATSSKPQTPKTPTGPCSTAPTQTKPTSTTAKSIATTRTAPPPKTGPKTPSPSAKPPWTPEPISRWEPNLDKYAAF